MGKECGIWVSRRLWGGGNMSALKTTAWEATLKVAGCNFQHLNFDNLIVPHLIS